MKKTKLFSLSVILQVLFICSLNAQNPVLSFDGIDDHVSLGTSTGNGIRTIEMWFKPGIDINPLLNDKMVLVAREESLDNYDEFNLHFIEHGNTNAGRLCFFISVGPGTSNYYYVISDSDTWNSGQWYHVASVIHPSQGMMMFIDGVKQADTNSYVFSTAYTSDYTMLGCQGDAFTRFFNGSIDDVRFSSDAQYLSDFTPPCPDLSPDTSTTALWNLNENIGNIVYDTSTNQYYGIVYGASWDISNICDTLPGGNALYFDGIDDYVDLGPDAGNGVRTIELWFSPANKIDNSISDYAALVARNNGLSNEHEITLAFSGASGSKGKLYFGIKDSNGNQSLIFSDSDSWDADKWYHVAAVIDPLQGMRMFIDGVKQMDTNSYTSATTNFTTITSVGSWGDTLVRLFNGRIDDVRFSSEAMYTSNFIPPCPDLMSNNYTVGLWNFNESGGSIAYDSSMNLYNGQIFGATRIYANVCDTIPGGNALYFDGIDDYVDLGPDVGNGVRTIELWFSPANKIDNSISDYAALVARNNGLSNEHEITLAFSGASGSKGKLYFGIKDSNGNQSLIFSDSDSWDADKWYHVAAVIDPLQGMRMFIDGVKQMDTNSYTSATTNFTTITSVGSWGDTLVRLFNGRIDDVRFSSEAMYTSNFIPPCPDLMSNNFTIGLWNFNESGGTIAYDSSMNSYNGQIVGATRIYANICDTIPGGNALYFDGIDDYVDLGPDVGNGVRTIELWFRLEVDINPNLNTYITMMGREESLDNYDEFNIHFQHSSMTDPGTLCFFLSEDISNYYYVISDNNTWIANEWYHLAAVIHPVKGMMLFINGIKQADTNSYTLAAAYTSDLTMLGCQGDAFMRFFNGSIDDVRFSSEAKYTSDFTPPCPDLMADTSTIGLWNFNENSGIIAYDSSGHSYDGMLYGAFRINAFICEDTIITATDNLFPRSSNSFISIYPNPSENVFIFDFNSNTKADFVIEIFDYLGKLISVKYFDQNSVKVDLNSVNRGIYLYRIRENERIIKSGKLIIQ